MWSMILIKDFQMYYDSLLTIAIPTFNRSKFLYKNLSYLKSQYNSNFSILIQDNASSDDTKYIVDKYKKLRPSN